MENLINMLTASDGRTGADIFSEFLENGHDPVKNGVVVHTLRHGDITITVPDKSEEYFNIETQWAGAAGRVPADDLLDTLLWCVFEEDDESA